MLSDIPKDLKRLKRKDIDNEIARAGIIAELDAVNLYEQMSGAAQNPKLKKVLLDIAREEKAHVGEFEAMLLAGDKEQVKETEAGKKEVSGM